MNENTITSALQPAFFGKLKVEPEEFNLLNSLDYEEWFASFEGLRNVYQDVFSHFSSQENQEFKNFESEEFLRTERNIDSNGRAELFENKDSEANFELKSINGVALDQIKVDQVQDFSSTPEGLIGLFENLVEDNANQSFFDENNNEKLSWDQSDVNPKSEKSKTDSIQNKTSQAISKSSSNQKLKRWSRSDDIALFDELYKECTKRHLNISDVFERASFNNKYKNLLNQVKLKVEWKWNDVKFLARIRRLGKDQKLSFRQFKLFRKLCREQLQISEEVNFSSLVKYFPGKLEATLQNEFREYLKTNHKVFKKLGNKI